MTSSKPNLGILLHRLQNFMTRPKVAAIHSEYKAKSITKTHFAMHHHPLCVPTSLVEGMPQMLA